MSDHCERCCPNQPEPQPPPDTSWITMTCACGCGTWPHQRRSFWEWLRWVMSNRTGHL